MNTTSSQIIPINSLVPEALDMTLSVLGDGPKKAVFFTLEQKYNLPLHGPLLSIDRVSNAILDLFGQDGGRLLLEKLWINLEGLAESKSKLSSHAVRRTEISIAHSHEWLGTDESYNKLISKVFADFIVEMYGQEMHTWLEDKMRNEGTTLLKCYLDADKINEILWRLFRSATSLLIENLMLRLSSATKSQPIHYNTELSLKESLDQFRRVAKQIV